MQSPGARLRAYLVDGVRELWVRPAAQVPALDALRTLAIALVIATHVATRWTDSESLPISLTQHPFFYWGWTGVDLFFVLSGYLIGKQLWREFSRTGDIRIGRFLLRRGLRIWPLYYFFLFFPVLFGAPLLARWKDVVFGRRLADEEVLSPDLPDRLAEGFSTAVPVFRFLDGLEPG